MDIIFDTVTEETLIELEKTQKDFWNVPRKTGVLLNMFVKMMNAKSVLERFTFVIAESLLSKIASDPISLTRAIIFLT